MTRWLGNPPWKADSSDDSSTDSIDTLDTLRDWDDHEEDLAAEIQDLEDDMLKFLNKDKNKDDASIVHNDNDGNDSSDSLIDSDDESITSNNDNTNDISMSITSDDKPKSTSHCGRISKLTGRKQ